MNGEIRKIVVDVYRKTIKEGPYPDDFKRALRTHERVPLFINNLVRELSAPLLNVKRETIELAARDMTRLFVSGCFVKAEERAMSEVRKAQLKAQAQRVKEMKQLADAVDAQGEANEKIIETEKGQISCSKITMEQSDLA